MSDKFKFDVVIGNPPYQEEATGDGTQAPPIYHKFMEEAYKIAKPWSLWSCSPPATFSLFKASRTVSVTSLMLCSVPVRCPTMKPS